MKSNPHTGVSGLRSETVGDLYPYTVRVIDVDSEMYCQAFHCLSGWTGSMFSVSWYGFEIAHNMAESQCMVFKNHAAQLVKPAGGVSS